MHAVLDLHTLTLTSVAGLSTTELLARVQSERESRRIDVSSAGLMEVIYEGVRLQSSRYVMMTLEPYV